MTQLVLARKYRPKVFSALVGQPHVVKAITNALQTQRLHHAYLFTGTRGVGKTTISRILAKSLNCEVGVTDQPCGVCEACVAIDAGRFPDYIELDAASNRGVDEIQQLLDQSVYRPVQGRFKVFMIDEVHMLSNHAFNAMLKTLEEPPEHLKFVLATTDPQKVPVTVLSRCLQFNLRPMAADTVFDHLQKVLADEGMSADDEALRILAQAARGSMRDALSLTDQAIAYCAQQLHAAGVRDMLGMVSQEPVLALFKALLQGQAAEMLDILTALRQQGVSALSILDEMVDLTHRMAVAQATGLAHDPSDPHPLAERLLALAAEWPADDLQLLYSLCLHARSENGLAPDEHAALSMALLRFLAFRPAEAEKKSPELAQTLPVIEVQAPALVEPEREASTGLASNPLPSGDAWFEQVEQLLNRQAIQALTRELALNCQWLGEDEQAWLLRTDKSALNTQANRERLQSALAELGHAVTLRIEVGPVTDTPALRLAAEQARRLEQAQSQVLSDPYVQRLMREFGAQIVPGSIQPPRKDLCSTKDNSPAS